jgi:hypothetical protein
MSKQCVCANCGYMGSPAKVTQGSFWVEVALWCFFIIPGLIYSIWRLSSKRLACPSCGAENMIPIDSPKGQQIVSATRAPAASP